MSDIAWLLERVEAAKRELNYIDERRGYSDERQHLILDSLAALLSAKLAQESEQ